MKDKSKIKTKEKFLKDFYNLDPPVMEWDKYKLKKHGLLPRCLVLNDKYGCITITDDGIIVTIGRTFDGDGVFFDYTVPLEGCFGVLSQNNIGVYKKEFDMIEEGDSYGLELLLNWIKTVAEAHYELNRKHFIDVAKDMDRLNKQNRVKETE